MIKRSIQWAVEASLTKYPVAGIVGSRQAGKTTLAKMIMKGLSRKVIYLDLDLPSDTNKLYDPELYLGRFTDSLVIIDEIQRMPSLFPLIRALVDRKRAAGRFLVLGSASPELVRHSSESLAGRIIYHELPPLSLDETGFEDVQRLWLRGGYPSSYLAESAEDSVSWRESFIKTYLERDIPQFGIRVPSSQLRRFWTMLAHSHGHLWNASQMSGSLGVSAPTVRSYLDILEETFVARRLQPYYFNVKKRLVKAPKVYIRDSGLLHSLLRTSDIEDLLGNPSVGRSWEGFVIEQIIGMLPEGWDHFFYRTSAGAELDLLLLDRKNRPTAVEIKYSASPKAEKGFWNAVEDLSCRKAFIVYPGEETYSSGKNVLTLSVRELNKIIE